MQLFKNNYLKNIYENPVPKNRTAYIYFLVMDSGIKLAAGIAV